MTFQEEWEILEKCTIDTEMDILKARQQVRYFAKNTGMGIIEQTRLTTATSELLRNMYNYANGGEVFVHKGFINNKLALIITCADQGPGIDDLEMAMSDGYTSGMGMGYGLPGAKRLVDEFQIETKKGVGTTVRLIKWK